MKWRSTNKHQCYADAARANSAIEQCQTDVIGGIDYSQSGVLVIKPAYLMIEAGTTRQFEVYYQSNNIETRIIQALQFESVNPSIASVGPHNGSLIAIKPGITTVQVKWNGLSAAAQVEVVDECAAYPSRIFMLIDNSPSMSQPFPGFGNKINYAKALARKFAQGINYAKDTLYIGTINSSPRIYETPIFNTQQAESVVNNISLATEKGTKIIKALTDTLMLIDAIGANQGINLIICITDGHDDGSMSQSSFYANVIPTLPAKRVVLMNVGVRSRGNDFNMLYSFATGGFFLNATPENANAIMELSSGLKSYLCSGNCLPREAYTINAGKLNYSNFASFDVTNGSVDLLGNGFYDYLPGNGLYVSLVGGSSGLSELVYYDTWTPSQIPYYHSTIDTMLAYTTFGAKRGVVDGVRIKTYLSTLPGFAPIPIGSHNAGRLSRFSIYGCNRPNQMVLLKTFFLNCSNDNDLHRMIGPNTSYIFRLGNTQKYEDYYLVTEADCENRGACIIHSVEFFKADIIQNPVYGTIKSKPPFVLPANTQFRLTLIMAGNQRYQSTGDPVNVRIETLDGTPVFVQTPVVPWNDGFTAYRYTAYSPPVANTCRISIRQMNAVAPGAGVLLKEVRLELLPSNQVLFSGTFANENQITIQPECNDQFSIYNPVKCGGVGCLNAPPDSQTQDLTADFPVLIE